MNIKEVELVVTGTGRSGTTFVCSLLEACGYDFGTEHRKYEDRGVVNINRRMQQGLYDRGLHEVTVPGGNADKGGGWFDDTLGPQNPQRRFAATARYVATDLQDTVERTNFSQAIKDPRLCWTLPVWVELGLRPKMIVVAHRDIDICAESNAERHPGMSATWGRVQNAVVFGRLMNTIMSCNLPLVVAQYPSIGTDFMHATRVLTGLVGEGQLAKAWETVDRTRCFHSLRRA